MPFTGCDFKPAANPGGFFYARAINTLPAWQDERHDLRSLAAHGSRRRCTELPDDVA
jgi:hypothetical protein